MLATLAGRAALDEATCELGAQIRAYIAVCTNIDPTRNLKGEALDQSSDLLTIICSVELGLEWKRQHDAAAVLMTLVGKIPTLNAVFALPQQTICHYCEFGDVADVDPVDPDDDQSSTMLITHVRECTGDMASVIQDLWTSLPESKAGPSACKVCSRHLQPGMSDADYEEWFNSVYEKQETREATLQFCTQQKGHARADINGSCELVFVSILRDDYDAKGRGVKNLREICPPLEVVLGGAMLDLVWVGIHTGSTL